MMENTISTKDIPARIESLEWDIIDWYMFKGYWLQTFLNTPEILNDIGMAATIRITHRHLEVEIILTP